MSNLDFDPKYIPDPANIIDLSRQRALGAVATTEGDPDEAARAIDIADTTGAPPSVVAGDLEHHEKQLKTNLSSDLIKNNPYLLDYINSHPLAAQLSGNDLGKLDKSSASLQMLAKTPVGKSLSILSSPEYYKDILEIAKEGFTSLGGDPELAKATEEYALKQGMDPILAKRAGERASEQASRTSVTQLLPIVQAALSPAIAYYRQAVSKPLEEATGFPHEATEGWTMVGLGALGLRAMRTAKAVDPYVKAGKDVPLGVDPLTDQIKLSESEVEVNALMDAIKDAAKTQTRELNSDMYAGFARQHVEDETVGVHGDAVRALYGDKFPEVDDALLGFIARLEGKLAAAEATGGYVDIPMAEYIAKVEPEVAKALEDFTRVRQGGVSKGEAKDIKAMVEAYHGSPHDFEAFSMEKIGTGEGAQSYGHGLYFAEQPDVAGTYKGDVRNRGRYTYKGKELSTDGVYTLDNAATPEMAAAFALHEAGDSVKDATMRLGAAIRRDPSQRDFLSEAASLLPEIKPVSKGAIYKVRINADKEQFLDWDKPLGEQEAGPKIIKALKEEVAKDPDFAQAIEDWGPIEALKGEHLHQALQDYAEWADLPGLERQREFEQPIQGRSDVAAFLKYKGIPGIKYLDQGSRGHLTKGLMEERLASLEYDLKWTRENPEEAERNSKIDIVKITSRIQDKIDATKRELSLVQGEPTHNFVLFDDSLVSITHKNDQPLPPKYAVETVRDAAALVPKERKLELRRTAELEPVSTATGDTGFMSEKVHHFGIHNETGQIADLFVAEEKGGKRLYVDDIRGIGGNGPNTIGPRALRDLLEQLKAEFPNAEELTGFRVSGARDKAGTWETKGKVSIKLAEPTASDHLFQILLDDRIERLGEVTEQGEGFKATTIPEARWQNFERSIVEKIDAEIEKLGIVDVDVEATHRIENAKGEMVRGLYQSYENARPTILVALTADDPVGVLRHEFMHDLRTRGLLDEAEWTMLEKGADTEGWIEKHDIKNRYPELNEEGWKEEAVADEYANWRRNGKPADSLYAKVFQKIDQLIEAIRAAMRQLFGTENWKDIFDKIESGEVAQREPTTEFGDVTKEAKQPELPGTRRMEDRDPFAEAAAVGMTVPQYKLWLKNIAERHREDLRIESERAMKDAKKRQTEEWKRNYAETRERVVAKISERPDIATDNLLREQRLFGKKTDPVKLGSEFLTDEHKAALPKDYYAKGGSSPDEVAGLTGYQTGQELIAGLTTLNAQRKASGMRLIDYNRRLISAETERQMEAKYGRSADAILEDAKEQVLSQTQIDWLHEDVLRDALKANVEFSITKDQMKAWAQETFDGLGTKDVSSDKFLADAGRAGRTAEFAALKGDFVEGFRQKEKQYRAVMMARLAKDFESAQGAVDKLAYRMRNEVNKNIEQEFTNYIHGLFKEAGYPIRLSEDMIAASIKFEGQGSLDNFVADKRGYGYDIAIEDGYAAKPTDQMTTKEFYQFKDAVETLYHAGREAKKITVAGERMDYEAWRDRATAQLEQRPMRSVEALEKGGRWLYKIDASLTRMEELMKSFDFREEAGPFFEAVIVPFAKSKADAFDKLTDLSKKFTELKHFNKEWRKGLDTEIVQDWITDPINGGRFKLTRWNMIKMMYNMGTESNFNALARGIAAGWLEKGRIPTKEQVAAARFMIEDLVHSNATKQDWQHVQEMFDIFKGWKPEGDTLYRNLSGKPPKWVPDREIQTPHGNFAGGYFPLIPDKSRLVGKGIRESEGVVGDGPLGADFFRATVHNAFYRERTGATYWVDITSGIEQLAGRMQQVVHDLAYREFVVNTGKIFYDPIMRDTINKHYGPEYLDQLQPWLKRVANEFTGNEKELQGFNNFLRQVRLNLIAYALPLNYTVMGTPSLGTANIKQLYAFNADRKANMKLVMDNSRELKHMLYNLDRDVSASINAALGKGTYTEYQMWAVEKLFKPLTAVEQESRAVTFYGEFMHQKSLGKTDFEAASLGDSLIRERHGASAVGDLPALMSSKNEFVRMATVFMGYFTTTRNWARQMPDAYRQGDYNEMAKIMWGTFGIATLYNLAVFTQPKKDEPLPKFIARAILNTPLSMVPIGREIGSYYLEGYQPVSPVFSVARSLGNIGKDGWDAYQGKEPKHPVRHVIGGIGALAGIPGTLQVGRTVDFLNNVRRETEQPTDFNEWARGIFTGESRLKK